MQHSLTIRFKSQPNNWQINTFKEKVSIGKKDLCLVGSMATHNSYPSLSGSACEVRYFPLQRSYWELLERIAIFEAMVDDKRDKFNTINWETGNWESQIARDVVFAPDHRDSKPAKSNGVALHTNRIDASIAAAFELIERHAVIDSWLGHRIPEPIRASILLDEAQYLNEFYKVTVFHFGATRIRPLKTIGETLGVFLWPKNPAYPFVYGFGCHSNPHKAIFKAWSEAQQRLGFLWGESIPTSPPKVEATPLFHQEWYLYPPHQKLIRHWLRGGFYLGEDFANPSFDVNLAFVPLNSGFTDENYWVIKAVSDTCHPLEFGPLYDTDAIPLQEGQEIHPVA